MRAVVRGARTLRHDFGSGRPCTVALQLAIRNCLPTPVSLSMEARPLQPPPAASSGAAAAPGELLESTKSSVYNLTDGLSAIEVFSVACMDSFQFLLATVARARDSVDSLQCSLMCCLSCACPDVLIKATRSVSCVV